MRVRRSTPRGGARDLSRQACDGRRRRGPWLLAMLLCGGLLACWPPAPALAAATGRARGGQRATPSREGRSRRRLQVDLRRAVASYAAMQHHFYLSGSGLYRGASDGYAFLWPFSQALAATVSIASIHGEQARYAYQLHLRMEGLATYWGVASAAAGTTAPAAQMPSYISASTASQEGGTTSYYDDNEWVAIELLRIHSLDGDEAALQDAERVMDFVIASWRSSPGLACPGGVPFSDSPRSTSRNTVTDAPGAELGVLLYDVDGNPAYLQFAERAYDWVRACLRSRGGLYADHIGPNGRLNRALWSYNQGTMMGAGALLYQATGDRAYLRQARATERAAAARFTLSRLLRESPFFVAVYLRNLLYLDSITHQPSGGSLAQRYADAAWRGLRLTGSGLYVFGFPPEPTLLGQASVAQVYALLSEPPSSYF